MRASTLAIVTVGIFSVASCSLTSPRPSTGNNSVFSLDGCLPSKGVPGGYYCPLIGDPDESGAFKYRIQVPAGAKVEVHQHSVAMHVKVLSGSKFIVFGQAPNRSRVEHVEAGKSFVIPARQWHEEWWDEKTVEEIEGIGPMETEVGTQP